MLINIDVKSHFLLLSLGLLSDLLPHVGLLSDEPIDSVQDIFELLLLLWVMYA